MYNLEAFSLSKEQIVAELSRLQLMMNGTGDCDHFHQYRNKWHPDVRRLFKRVSNNIGRQRKRLGKKRSVSLTIIDILIINLTNTHCFYTGVKLTPTNASFERVDMSVGYHRGNVVLCTQAANWAKCVLYENLCKTKQLRRENTTYEDMCRTITDKVNQSTNWVNS